MPEPEETTAATPEATETPTEPTVGSETELEEPSPVEVFRFDPFSQPVDDDGQPVVEETPAAKAAPAATAAAAPAATAAAASAPAGTQSTEELARLAGITKQLLGEVVQLKSTSPAAPAAPAAPTPPKSLYNIQIPDDLKAAILSEDADTRIKGFRALATGIASIVHENVQRAYEEHYTKNSETIKQQIMDAVALRESQNRMNTEFYTEYPQLSRVELRPVVSAAATAVVKESGGTFNWTPDFRKKVAERVFSVLGMTPPAKTPETPAGKPAARTTKPPAQRGTGVRPAAPATPKPGSQESHINDVFGASF